MSALTSPVMHRITYRVKPAAQSEGWEVKAAQMGIKCSAEPAYGFPGKTCWLVRRGSAAMTFTQDKYPRSGGMTTPIPEQVALFHDLCTCGVLEQMEG